MGIYVHTPVLRIKAFHAAFFEHHLLLNGNQTTAAFGKSWWFTLGSDRVLFSLTLKEECCKGNHKEGTHFGMIFLRCQEEE